MWTEEKLSKLVEYYGIPRKIITLIQHIYEGMSCRVVHAEASFQTVCYLLSRFSCYRLDYEDHL